jgi:hypothetical protein
LRGVNYYAAATQMRDNAQGWLPPYPYTEWWSARTYPAGSRIPFGQFHPETVQQELEAYGRMGFNNVRLFGSFLAWAIDRVRYRAHLRFIASVCRRYGMSITYVVWSSTGVNDGSALSPGLNPFFFMNDIARRGALANFPTFMQIQSDQRVIADPPAGSHFQLFLWAEPDYLLIGRVPGGPASWDAHLPFLQVPIDGVSSSLSMLVDRYLDDLALVFGQEVADVLFAYELANEPDVVTLVLPGASVQPAIDFLCHTHRRLVAAHEPASQRPLFTIGFGACNGWDAYVTPMREAGCALDYISFHTWTLPLPVGTPEDPPGSVSPADWRAAIAPCVAAAEALGVPLVCSEFYSPGKYRYEASGLGDLLGVLAEMDLGWQIWSILENNVFDPDWRAGRPPGAIWGADGLYVPHDFPNGVWTTTAPADGVVGKVFGLSITRKEFHGAEEDLDALLRATGGRPPA